MKVMDMNYNINEKGVISNVQLCGLNGSEYVTSLKAALQLLRPRNPATVFVEGAKEGLFNEVTDEEYACMLYCVKEVASIWKSDDPNNTGSTEYSKNVMSLLVNAIELISRQASELYQLKHPQTKGGGDGK